MTPTIHLNGTSGEMLIQGYRPALDALREAMDKFWEIEFNARDYYVQGPDAWQAARQERTAESAKLQQVYEYLERQLISIHSQMKDRTRGRTP